MISRIWKLPQWFIVLSLLYISFGFLVASIRPPFFGEDEAGHFYYVESLGRNNKWNIFEPEGNTSSIGMRLAYYIWDDANDKNKIYELISEDKITHYSEYGSGNIAPTAYQPPLYYWLMSQVYKIGMNKNIFISFYLLRYINVLIGYFLLLFMYLISLELFIDKKSQMFFTILVGILPLFILTAATVTVQTLVFVLYSVMLWSLLKAMENKKFYIVAIVVMWLGLLTQQAFLATPFLLGFVLIMDLLLKKLSFKEVIVLGAVFIGGVLFIAPQLWRRHELMIYTKTDFQKRLRRLTPGSYLLTQILRLKKELVYGWWDQTRSMIPYYASDTFEKFARLTMFVGGLGFVLAMSKRYKDIRQNTKMFRWILIGGFLLVGFLIGHIWYDYLQVVFSAEEYIKARYFYPLLPFLFWAFVVGLRQIFEREIIWSGVVLLTSFSLLFMQFTAVIWLILEVTKV